MIKNIKREMYRRIRDSKLEIVTLEDLRDLNQKSPKLTKNDRGLHRICERLRHDALLIPTNTRGIYLVNHPEFDT